MKVFLKRAFILSAILVSYSFTSAWSSHQTVWENEDNAKAHVAKIRKDTYSIQLSSFSIPLGKKAVILPQKNLID